MLMGAVRDTNMLSQWRTVFQAARHIPLESGDARAGCAPQAPLGPTSPWEAPGVRVGDAGGSRGVLESWAVSVVSLPDGKFRANRPTPVTRRFCQEISDEIYFH